MKNQQEAAKDKGPPLSTAGLVFSVVTHLLLLCPVIYILIVAFGDLDRSAIFVWHPICMSLGGGLLIMEGVFSISGDAYLTKRMSRANRIRLHWICNLIGVGLMTIGFVMIIINKNTHDTPHFVTTHSILGLVTFVLVCCVASFGILANNSHWFYPRLRPILLKVVHAYAGIGLTVLILVTVVNGTFNSWWTHPEVDASVTGRALVIASFAVAAVFILVKPIIATFARTRVLMKPRPQQPAQQPQEQQEQLEQQEQQLPVVTTST